MAKSFKQLVEEAIANLTPVMRVSSFETFKSFGDAILILQDGDVRWRLIRERSNVHVQASSSQGPDKWHNIAEIEAMYGVITPQIAGYPAQTLETAIERMVRVRSDLHRSFGRD